MNSPRQWLSVIKRCDGPIARLVCIPYSGADAHAYAQWAAFMPPGIELLAVRLPGRGVRSAEPPSVDLRAAAAHIAEAIAQLDPMPTVLFGHSLGGLLCYETVSRLEAAGEAHNLRHAFFSGCLSPGYHACKAETEEPLSDEEVIERLRRYEGTPQEVFDDPALLALFLPPLRSDFEMIAKYRPASLAAVDAPVTIFTGKNEGVTAEQIDEWRGYARNYFSKFQFNGGHFFIHSDRVNVIRRIFR